MKLLILVGLSALALSTGCSSATPPTKPGGSEDPSTESIQKEIKSSQEKVAADQKEYGQALCDGCMYAYAKLRFWADVGSRTRLPQVTLTSAQWDAVPSAAQTGKVNTCERGAPVDNQGVPIDDTGLPYQWAEQLRAIAPLRDGTIAGDACVAVKGDSGVYSGTESPASAAMYCNALITAKMKAKYSWFVNGTCK